LNPDDTDEFEVPPLPPTPPVYERVEPRYFGVTPHVLVGVLGAIALLAGVALLASGSPSVGALLLVAGLLLAILFGEQARRRRASSLDRAAAAAVDRSLALAGFTRATVGAWTSASRRAAKLRLEARKLARERSHVQYELGAAVHAEDEPRTNELRTRMRTLDREIERKGREARAAIVAAQRRTRAEQQAVASTEVRRP
jgi:membrane protein implicated in regulation of membrane protease activity